MKDELKVKEFLKNLGKNRCGRCDFEVDHGKAYITAVLDIESNIITIELYFKSSFTDLIWSQEFTYEDNWYNKGYNWFDKDVSLAKEIMGIADRHLTLYNRYIETLPKSLTLQKVMDLILSGAITEIYHAEPGQQFALRNVTITEWWRIDSFKIVDDKIVGYRITNMDDLKTKYIERPEALDIVGKFRKYRDVLFSTYVPIK